jgi:hypothetical protein
LGAPKLVSPSLARYEDDEQAREVGRS